MHFYSLLSVLAAQHQKQSFIHGVRDCFLFIPRLISNFFGAHHTLYLLHGSNYYQAGFWLVALVVVLLLSGYGFHRR